MKLLKLAMTSTLALMAVSHVAAAQDMRTGRVYAFSSAAKGTCPSLHWHLVVGTNNSLSGLISWNDMKSVARVSGTVDMRARTFQAKAEEVGGQGRIANVTGAVRDDGWLTASIQGPEVTCTNLSVPWFEPPPPGA